MSAGIRDASDRLARPVAPPGESAEDRTRRLEALVASRLDERRGLLADTRIVVEPFSGTRPIANVDLGSYAFDGHPGQRFNLRNPVGRAVIQGYGEHMRDLTAEEIEAEIAEATAALRWRLLHE